MKVRALRGVCIGVERHLAPGEEAEVDAGSAHFLLSIRAVEEVKASPPAAEPAPTEITEEPPKKAARKEK